MVWAVLQLLPEGTAELAVATRRSGSTTIVSGLGDRHATPRLIEAAVGAT